MTEYELMKQFENNLVTLINKCNIQKLGDIFDEVNNKFQFALKINLNNDKFYYYLIFILYIIFT